MTRMSAYDERSVKSLQRFVTGGNASLRQNNLNMALQVAKMTKKDTKGPKKMPKRPKKRKVHAGIEPAFPEDQYISSESDVIATTLMDLLCRRVSNPRISVLVKFFREFRSRYPAGLRLAGTYKRWHVRCASVYPVIG